VWRRPLARHDFDPPAAHHPTPQTHQIIPNTDIVVGDVMLIDTGDKIVADGVMVDGHHLVSCHGGGRATVAGRGRAAQLHFTVSGVFRN
jgi:hypothetical protein